MNEQTIIAYKAKMAQNDSENAFLQSMIDIAEIGWQQDVDLIASEIQTNKDAVASQIAGLEESVTTKDVELAQKVVEIETLTAVKEDLDLSFASQ